MNDPASDGDIASVWSAMRHRKIVQWTLAYVATAWALLQGLQFLADLYGWPLQVLRWITLGLALGLPIVLVLAWYHGDRGEQRIRGTELAIISLLFLVGGGIFWLYDRAREDEAEGVKAQGAAPVASIEVAAPAPDAKSIAVLPFADMSPEKNQEYMSDGIAEELLNLLAKVPDLKVIARTSSFAFKGQNVEIAEIAKRLNVAHVLEGSVRKSGNTVRITAQLIRTSDSMHLWSERYDRPLDDIFAVQDEIANAIVQALQIRLTGGTVGVQGGGTQDREAYELFLRARNGEDWNTRESLDAAGRYLHRAIELDPQYSEAWSTLAGVYIAKAELGHLNPSEGFERARRLTQRALVLDPRSADAHADLLYIYLTYDWNWAASETQAERALAIDSTDPGVLNSCGRLSIALGRWDDAERWFRAALARNPLDDYLTYNLALTFYLDGRFAPAEESMRRLLEISPKFVWGRVLLGQALLMQGKVNEALAIAHDDTEEQMRLVVLPMFFWAAGHHDKADEALRAQIERWGDSGASFVALSYGHRGDYDLALKWLDQAFEQKDPALIEVLRDPLFGGMLDDPRYKAFLRKMRLPERPRA